MRTHLKDFLKGKKGQAGFSLIEALVAIAIFAIGILGCYKMQLSSTHSNAMGERVSTATNWAAYVIEELLAKDYDDPLLDDDGSGVADKAAGLDDLEADADGVIYIQPDGSKSPPSPTPAPSSYLYSVSWNVAEGTATETSVLRDVKQIRVHVVRKGGIGSGKLYSHDYFKTEGI